MRGQVKVYQKKIVARRRRRAFLIVLYSIVFTGLVVSGLSYLTHLDSLSIRSVKVEGAFRLSSAQAESVALSRLAGNYGYLFSRSNSFLYPRQSIRRDLEALPAVKSARISRSGLGELVVRIEERKEAALWCAGDSGKTDDCYSLDDKGLVFAKRTNMCLDSGACMPNPGEAGAPYIYRGLISGDPVGKTLLPEEEFKKMGFFMDQVGGLSDDPREAVLTPEGYVTVYLKQGGKLVVNRSDDLSTVLANIATVITNRTIAPSFAAFLQDLDYIKLDTGNKIVYKLKSSTKASE